MDVHVIELRGRKGLAEVLLDNYQRYSTEAENLMQQYQRKMGEHQDQLFTLMKEIALSDEHLLKDAREELVRDRERYQELIGENDETIGLLEGALENIELAIGNTKVPAVRQELMQLKSIYQESLKSEKEGKTGYEESITEEISDKELLARKRQAIGKKVEYNQEDEAENLLKVPQEIIDTERKAWEYLRLYLILTGSLSAKESAE